MTVSALMEKSRRQLWQQQSWDLRAGDACTLSDSQKEQDTRLANTPGQTSIPSRHCPEQFRQCQVWCEQQVSLQPISTGQ